MSTRSDAQIQEILDLQYRNIDATGIGDAGGLRGSATAGNFYVALFTDTVEVAYTGYARVPIARSSSGFGRTGNVVSNNNELLYTLCPTGTTSQSATKAKIYTALTGGNLRDTVTLPYPIPIQVGQRPVVEAGAITITGS